MSHAPRTLSEALPCLDELASRRLLALLLSTGGADEAA